MFRYSMILLPLFLMVAGCCTHGPLDPTPNSNLYRTTQFHIVSDVLGESDDVDARGGYIELRLNADSSMRWTQNVPGTNLLELDGSYTISGDTLNINGDGPWRYSEPFILQNGEIRITSKPRRGFVDVIFKKVE